VPEPGPVGVAAARLPAGGFPGYPCLDVSVFHCSKSLVFFLRLSSPCLLCLGSMGNFFR
jgi:hypothetical protein